MRNAGASIDPPPDPFAAVRPDSPVALPVDRQYSKDDQDQARGRPSGARKKLPRGVSPLPPGVSPDIFASTPPPGNGGPSSPAVTLPPPVGPPEPWPMTGSVRVRRPDGEPRAESLAAAETEPAEGRGRLRVPLMVFGAISLLFLLAYGVPATYMWGKVLPGTHVGDVRIGGLNATQAIDRLHRRYDGNDQEAVGLMLDGRRVAVLDPRDAGLTIDVEATVADAETGFPGPFAVWQALTGDRDLPLRVSLNQVKLTERVGKIAKEIDRPAREGAIVYKGTTPELLTPREGVVLDQAATGSAIRRAFVNAPASVTLPVAPVRPKATAEEFDKALVTARHAVAEPITLVNGGRRVRLSPKVIAANLTFTADDYGWVRPVFDARKAVAGLETKLVGVAEAPREAGFVIENQVPKLVHARTGKGVDTDRLAEAVGKVITAGGSRTIPVSLAITEPTLSDQEAMQLGVAEKVSEFATSYTCCAARVTNIHKAADLVDGMLVRPGQTFSLNEVIGDPDASRGFVPAQSIEDDRLVVAMGGGLSQFATTMYNAAFLAGMEDVEHTPYPFHVASYPAGRDATLSYPETDLRWRNDTEYGVLIKASYTGTSVTVALWSTQKYDRIDADTSEHSSPTQPETVTDSEPGCLPMQGTPGFTVTVTRVFLKDGKVFKKDRARTTEYAPAPKVICQQARSAVKQDQRPGNGAVQPQPPGQALDVSASTKQRRKNAKKAVKSNNGNGNGKTKTKTKSNNGNGNGNGKH
ncbi:VanW family protein [Sphaerisporangium perillae]|uniref:VanW family protein n=1 Tax=Sphaerisporangium perillae TaxID=2935860 RepID=UPI00200BE408|nr:VanW family protein [Sphaerisporangium perillae]